MKHIEKVFNEWSNEFNKFDRVEEKMHPRPDLCAFLMLDKLYPNDSWKMICMAEQDKIFLDVDCEMLDATEEELIDLHRCGVDFDDGSLVMYV